MTRRARRRPVVSLLVVAALAFGLPLAGYLSFQYWMERDFASATSGFSALFGVDEISVQELQRRRDFEKPTLLIDVRTAAEQSVSRIGGFPVLSVQPGEVAQRAERIRAFLASHPEARVVVYCAGGYRSARGVSQLPEDLHSAAEQPRVVNLQGGVIAWANAGGTLVDPQSEEPVQKVHGYNETWAQYVEAPNEAVLRPPIPGKPESRQKQTPDSSAQNGSERPQ